jgi:hypothetical protein
MSNAPTPTHPETLPAKRLSAMSPEQAALLALSSRLCETFVLTHHEDRRAHRAWSVSYEDGTLVAEGTSARDAVEQAEELLS